MDHDIRKAADTRAQLVLQLAGQPVRVSQGLALSPREGQEQDGSGVGGDQADTLGLAARSLPHQLRGGTDGAVG
jgi:hypothetical protein